MIRFFFRLLLGLAAIGAVSCRPDKPECIRESSGMPPIFPFYENGIEIPCNIAPLNFGLPDSVLQAYVEIRSSCAQGRFKAKRRMEFGLRFWKRLMAAANNGQTDTVFVKIYLKSPTGWTGYAPLRWIVREQPIDTYLVYRLLPSIEGAYSTEKNGYNIMELRQRNLENFEEQTLVSNAGMDRNCFNCHVFPQGDAQKMVFHLRRPSEGSLYIDGEDILKIVPPTAQEALKDLPDSLRMPLNLVYSAWHPDGKWIAFSSNIMGIYGYSAHHAYADIFDSACNIVLYNTESRQLVLDKTLWTVSHEETWPDWSPDGKWLYFCRAPKLPAELTDRYPVLGERIKHIHFDLCRVAFDAESGTFADSVQVIAVSDTRASYSMPKVNPDGKSVLLCRSDFNSVPYHANGNLFLIDLENIGKALHGGESLENGENPADILNSGECESYHDWSRNGRWTVFGSKRQNGHYQWLYIAYFDGKRFGIPFLLPQKKGNFYHHCFRVFNVPAFTRNVSTLTPAKASAGKRSPAQPVGVSLRKTAD